MLRGQADRLRGTPHKPRNLHDPAIFFQHAANSIADAYVVIDDEGVGQSGRGDFQLPQHVSENTHVRWPAVSKEDVGLITSKLL